MVEIQKGVEKNRDANCCKLHNYWGALMDVLSELDMAQPVRLVSNMACHNSQHYYVTHCLVNSRSLASTNIA